MRRPIYDLKKEFEGFNNSSPAEQWKAPQYAFFAEREAKIFLAYSR
ncbi:hypothetical protein [Bradyrhizobium sp. CCBAU 21359]|nr:hypothetical protein [Bradyrhizobium sp. CCBAU 21359]